MRASMSAAVVGGKGTHMIQGLRQTVLGWCPHDPCFAVRDGHGYGVNWQASETKRRWAMPDSIGINLFRFLPFVCVWFQSDVNFFVSPFVPSHLTDEQKHFTNYHQRLLPIPMAQQTQ